MSKLTKWERIKDEVQHLKDISGMSVDLEIAETVAVLRYLDINTTASCAGHLDRITRGPYIVFLAPQIPQLRLQMKQIGDRKKNEYKIVLNQAKHHNVLEIQTLFPYLEAFYSNRIVPYNQRIIIECFSHGDNTLLCQGVELAHILNQEERIELLKHNQEEMSAFTQFVKNKLELE